MDDAKTVGSKYSVVTNVKALSRIKDILRGLNVNDIPVLDISKKDELETFVTMLEFELSADTENFNRFYKTITNTDDDFTEMTLNITHKVAMDFFTKLPLNFVNTIQILLNELKKRNDMVISKTEKTLENALKKLMKEEMVNTGILTDKNV